MKQAHFGSLIIKDDQGRHWEVVVAFAKEAIICDGAETRPTAHVLPRGEIVQWKADFRERD